MICRRNSLPIVHRSTRPAGGPFYGHSRPGAKASEAVIQNWWRQGMTGGAKAHYDGIVAFSQTDFTEDLKKITVPVLVMHSEDDQIVPYVASGPLSAKLLKNGTLKPKRTSRTAYPLRKRIRSIPTYWLPQELEDPLHVNQ
jgi:pimeloyl-ACP methyl ester carboxylesterase